MALEPEITVQPPLLDRLVDLDRTAAADPPQSRSAAVRALRDAIRRDLEWLLNTRQTSRDIPKPFTLLRESVFNYGLPDITSISLRTKPDADNLLAALEQTIARFEPRLAEIKVFAREPFSRLERTLHFHVEALLLVDPAPEAIVFDTILKVDRGTCEVKV